MSLVRRQVGTPVAGSGDEVHRPSRANGSTGTTGGSVTAHAAVSWRSVTIPKEHGGWGLTLEPVLLGLWVAPSAAGVAIGLAGFLAFLARTSLKVVLVDRRRQRWLPRSTKAARVAAAEVTLLGGSALAAGRWSGWTWLVPIALVSPLVILELWFDVRSRSRRLVPQLAGSIAIAATAAAIAIAGGEPARLAIALWLVVVARAVTSIPFVRVQIDRLRHGSGARAHSDAAQLVGVAIAAAAVLVDRRLLVGGIAVAVLAILQGRWVRRPPVPAKVLGLRQLLLGVAVVAAAAAGALR